MREHDVDLTRVPITECERQSLERLIKATLSWSELPLYEHEYHALKGFLEKLDQAGGIV